MGHMSALRGSHRSEEDGRLEPDRSGAGKLDLEMMMQLQMQDRSEKGIQHASAQRAPCAAGAQ